MTSRLIVLTFVLVICGYYNVTSDDCPLSDMIMFFVYIIAFAISCAIHCA